MSSAPVVVVGAGPVGLTAALLLARRGLRVTVLERRTAPYDLPRAVHLDGEALRVLQEVGVADDLVAAALPIAGMRLLDARLRILAQFTRQRGAGPHGWPVGVLFHQPDLDRLLRDQASRQPRISVRTGTEVVGLDGGRPGVRLTVRDAAGAESALEAAAVLGCDGANSTVRALIGAAMRDLGPPDRWLVLDVRAPGFVCWPGVHQVCDHRRAATYMPGPGDRCRFEFRLAPGESADDLDVDALLAPFGVGETTVERIAEYTFRAQVADRWRRGRVLLAGDAAHLTPPFIGQGLGLGLRDVHQLAWKLADVLAGHADDDLLDTHQAEREPHARSLIRLAQLVGRLMTRGGRSGAVVRRAVLTAVRRLPAASSLAEGGRTPPLPAGPLVRRHGRGGRLAGTLVPQPVVVLDGVRYRLDDLLGPGPAGLRVLDGHRVRVQTPATDRVVDSPQLAGWLRPAGAAAVVVRPDRIVRSASPVRVRWPGSGRRAARGHAGGVSYDVAAVRAHFPALRSGTAHFDGPGGSQTPDVVAAAVHDILTASIANRGRTTAAERLADDTVLAARAAVADLTGGEPGGVVFGRSATQLTYDLARVLSRTWGPGDEVVVSRLDHDANVRPWVQAAQARGATVRWASFDPATGELEPSAVGRLVDDRTRLVAVTGASNLIGTRPDVAAITALAHDAGALTWVDGVHLTAHAAVDVAELGADFFVCSPYKFLGPHCGCLVAAPALLETLHPDKLLPSTDAVPERFELGTLPYELLAGTTAAVDFLAGLAGGAGSRRERLVASMAALEVHEDRLRERVEEGLRDLPGVTLWSRAKQRTPTLLVTFDGRDAAGAHRFLAERRVNAPAGSFYAVEASRHLGLGDTGGLRIGLAPYNDDADVDRLLAGLRDWLA